MATMVLRDMMICPECGAEMFPCAFDKETRTISYRCRMAACLTEQTCSFEEVKLKEGERIHFVCLNDDGEVTWKCYEHGYCDYDIESLLEKDFTKFERCCCILGRDEDEIEMDVEYAQGEGREIIAKIIDLLNEIDENYIAELAEEMLSEDPVEAFDGDYVEAFVSAAICEVDGTDAFIFSMTNQIEMLFDIYIDMNGDLVE